MTRHLAKNSFIEKIYMHNKHSGTCAVRIDVIHKFRRSKSVAGQESEAAEAIRTLMVATSFRKYEVCCRRRQTPAVARKAFDIKLK